ncbi:uncharacterized protein LOC114537175 [Dendronephthya gigantea]|uniref:uncharacterized protein LOC114537175 n=1 Tax=Dendronephthya gigantea TaxID=151771 RepID=UPI00106A92A8|nr:uncharacterized protein LOC114537175 [Dendronephthya gigantea]
MADEWRLFFTDLESLLNFYEQNQRSNGVVTKELLSIRLEIAVKALQNIVIYISSENKPAVLEITRNFQVMYWDCVQVAVMSLVSPSLVMDGGVGRPKFNIREDTLIELRALGFSWTNIAKMLLVSRWTIYRRAREFGLIYMSRFSDITDQQLDDKVRSFINEHGNLVGSSIVWGHLRSAGLTVQRERVCKCLARIDPDNIRIRWAVTVSRRAYQCAGPNYIWYLDENHKLVKWGFVTHLAIDGYTRVITFGKTSNNNQADTVPRIFNQAVEQYGRPFRVRTDYGGENIKVWQND